ncbi:MAG: sugar ABC transporter permease [Acidimicrobiia bacterium]|nr:sugar ABC transporter permease [Acidimicrobiia bacterium]MDX2466576.1 sugar ABC transporter permease [Acidimicrobiia bacterium]
MTTNTRAPSPEIRALRSQNRFQKWFRELGWRHLVGLAALVFALFPVVWIISASVNPLGTLTSQQLIPDSPNLDSFRDLFEEVPYRAWYTNTMIIAGGAAALQVLLSALAAYAFSRMRFKGRRTGLLAVLLIQMFPQAVALVPIFLMMVSIKGVFPAIGLGSQAGLLLIYLGGALGMNTWLMKGFFDTVPVDLDESAKVDGATHNQIFFRIILPLVAPILAVIFLLSFIFLINDFLLADAVLGQGDSEKFTLAIGLQRYLSDQFNLRWGPFAAGALLLGVPVVVLFQFLQRYIVSGLTQGGVKG